MAKGGGERHRSTTAIQTSEQAWATGETSNAQLVNRTRALTIRPTDPEDGEIQRQRYAESQGRSGRTRQRRYHADDVDDVSRASTRQEGDDETHSGQ